MVAGVGKHQQLFSTRSLIGILLAVKFRSLMNEDYLAEWLPLDLDHFVVNFHQKFDPSRWPEAARRQEEEAAKSFLQVTDNRSAPPQKIAEEYFGVPAQCVCLGR